MFTVPRRKITLYGGMLKDILLSFQKNNMSGEKDISLFESAFAQYIGTKHSIAVSSGTAALSLILQNLDLKRGDEVLVPAYTFPSVPSCVENLGLIPKFIDIEMNSHNIDIHALETSITNKTKVIIATHLFGQPCNIARIKELSQKNKIYLIEDCAHAIGSKYKSQPVGTFGDASYYSFSLTKPFNLFNGGMIVLKNEDLYQKISIQVKDLPFPPRKNIIKNVIVAYFLYFLTIPFVFSITLYPILVLLSLVQKDLINSYNKIFKKIIFHKDTLYRFTPAQATCGCKMLKIFNTIEKQRAERVEVFEKLLEKAQISLKRPVSNEKNNPFHYFYVIEHPEKDKLAKELLWAGIDTGKYVMRNCGDIFDKDHSYPNTQKTYQFSLQIPIEFCSDNQLKKIIRILKKFDKTKIHKKMNKYFSIFK